MKTREILFRGKRVDNGEWVHGYYFQSIPETEQSYIISNTSPYNSEIELNGSHVLGMHNYHEVIPESVGQFTGLTDKNGKKIFEGDLLNHKTTVDNNWAKRDFQDHTIVEVGFLECCFLDLNSGINLKDAITCIVHRKIDFEIIGNIHDNK